MTTATRRTWKRRSDARPAEIRSAALQLFALQGYGGTTIEEIAEAGDVTVGTIYRYFRDKEALLHEIVEWGSREPFLPLVDPSSPDPADPSIPSLAGAIWAGSRREPHVHLLRLLVAEGGNAPALVERYRTAVLGPLERMVARAIEIPGEGEPLGLARALVGAILGASVLAGPPNARAAVVPQLGPEQTVAAILAGFDRGPALPPAAPTPPSKPSPRSRAPDSW
jgi:AcrR family transcriptional regulator